MRFIISLLSILALITSCKNSKEKSLLGSPDDFPADEYVINTDRDTTLLTKHGAILKIPIGAFAIDEGNTVTLEIKEAYTIHQMFEAGLRTASNGAPLSSGGMIYINAAAGQQVTIKQAIKVAIPANYLAENMKLFKGEKTQDGSINWIDPTPLPENKQANQISQGMSLFNSKCYSCHSIGKVGTGPDLANILKRSFFGIEGGYPNFHFRMYNRYGQYLNADTSSYFHYSEATAYACNVRKMFGSVPPLFPDLTQEDEIAVSSYIQNESNKKQLPMPSHAYLDSCIDSCRVYAEKSSLLRKRKEEIENRKRGLINDNGSMVDIKPDSLSTNDFITAETRGPVDFEEMVSPGNFDAVYYQFSIESFGWYNIDILMEDVKGVEESELFVSIVGDYRERVEVFLIIPSVKVYGGGGLTGRSPDEYAFFYKTGKLPLPQNEKAYIMAVTETKTSIAFALQEFTTTTKQQLNISLKAATKEEFRQAIDNITLDRLHIKVGDSKNNQEIRKIDAEVKDLDAEMNKLKNLKPKGCDCDCGTISVEGGSFDTPK